MRAFFIVLVWAAAFFSSISSSHAAMTRQDMADLYARSLENLNKGENAAAYVGYLRLLREEPGSSDIDFMLGQAAFAQGNYPIAVLSYIRVLKANPRHERARLELARAYDQMGQRDMARAELSALRDVNPGLPPASEMEKAIFDTTYSPWTIRGTAGSGVFYDSNANLGVSASEYMGFTLVQGKAKESFGAYFTGGLDAAYQMGPGSHWYLVGDVAATNRQYFNSDVDRRLTWGRAALGLRWASDKALFELRGKGEYLGRDAGDVLSSSGAEASFAYALTENLALITQGAYEYRNYARDFEAMRGKHTHVGEYVRYQFGKRRHEVMFGGNYFSENAREKRYDGQGFEILGRVQFHCPGNIKTGFLAAWRDTRYDAPPTGLGGGDRWEDQFKVGVEVEKGVTENLSINIQGQYTKNTSNHSLYRYNQKLLTIGLTYTF
jgi:tetratricopeptide (TPR) repeat protein